MCYPLLPPLPSPQTYTNICHERNIKLKKCEEKINSHLLTMSVQDSSLPEGCRTQSKHQCLASSCCCLPADLSYPASTRQPSLAAESTSVCRGRAWITHTLL